MQKPVHVPVVTAQEIDNRISKLEKTRGKKVSKPIQNDIRKSY